MGEVAAHLIQQSAAWAHRNGEGQEANPYPKNTLERAEWALQMAALHQQELTAIREELH